MNKYRIPSILLLLGSISFFILLCIRAVAAIHFQEVHHLITSGFEEESLLAMWKFQHGYAIYSDFHTMPFTASYFNWLFYALYGIFVTGMSHFFGLMDPTIPAIGRSLTVAVALLGFVIHYRFLNVIGQKTWPMMAVALSALLWLGPLLGFWAITVRPDVLALLFDLFALYAFLIFYPSFKLRAVLLAAFFCYLSWATKQINIIMPGAIGLFLLVQKDKTVFAFTFVLAALVGLTCLITTSAHLKILLFLDTAIPLSFKVWQVNLINFVKKTVPLWLGLLTLGWVALKHHADLKQNKPFLLSLCGVIAWSLVMLPASSKLGSAENYYFSLLLFLTLMVMSLVHNLPKTRFLALGSSSMGLAMIFSALMAYHQGKDNLQIQHQNYSQLKACIDSLPPPVFVVNHYGALPWMNPKTPPFVLAYNYWHDRKANRNFEHDGIGGLIKLGFFNALILPHNIGDSFDNANLSQFSLNNEVPCMGYKVLVKTNRA